MEVITLSKKIPSEKDIIDLEKRLLAMKAERESAKQAFLQALKTGEVISALSQAEAIQLMRQLQSRVQGARKRQRGAAVSPELKAQLEAALIQGGYTFTQLETMFGLSTSYMSRVKKELREQGKIKPEGYTDQQLQHQQPQEHKMAS
jgi:CRP-like cAMP-binding protein